MNDVISIEDKSDNYLRWIVNVNYKQLIKMWNLNDNQFKLFKLQFIGDFDFQRLDLNNLTYFRTSESKSFGLFKHYRSIETSTETSTKTLNETSNEQTNTTSFSFNGLTTTISASKLTKPIQIDENFLKKHFNFLFKKQNMITLLVLFLIIGSFLFIIMVLCTVGLSKSKILKKIKSLRRLSSAPSKFFTNSFTENTQETTKETKDTLDTIDKKDIAITKETKNKEPIKGIKGKLNKPAKAKPTKPNKNVRKRLNVEFKKGYLKKKIANYLKNYDSTQRHLEQKQTKMYQSKSIKKSKKRSKNLKSKRKAKDKRVRQMTFDNSIISTSSDSLNNLKDLKSTSLKNEDSLKNTIRNANEKVKLNTSKRIKLNGQTFKRMNQINSSNNSRYVSFEILSKSDLTQNYLKK